MKKTDLRDFIKGGGAVLITLLIGYVLTFSYKLFLARSLGTQNYGLYEMLFTIITVITIFCGLGLFSGISRFIPKYITQHKPAYIVGIIKFITTIQLITALLISALLLLLAPQITTFFNFPELFTTLLYIGAFIFPFLVFIRSYQQYFFAHKKSLIAKSGTQIISNGIMLIGAVIIFIFSFDVIAVALTLLVATILTFMYYFYNSFKLPKYTTQKPRYEIKKWFSYSSPLLFAGIIGTLLSWSDNFIIAKFLSASDVGIYAIAFSLAFYIFIAPKIFTGIFIPILTKDYEHNKPAFIQTFQKLRTWSFASSLIIGTLFIVFAREILLILFGSEYVPATVSLQILAISFIISSYFYFSGQIIQLHDKTLFILYINSAVLILNLIISIILVQMLGIAGVAIGTGVSFFLVRYILYLTSSKYITIPHNYSYLSKLILSVIGSMTLSYVLVKLFNIFIFSNMYVNAILTLSMYCFFLLICIYLFRLIEEDDWIILEVIENKTKLKLLWIKDIYDTNIFK